MHHLHRAIECNPEFSDAHAILAQEYKKKDDPRKDIFDFVVKNKLSLLEMSTQTANLEDIFRKLTK